MNLKIEDDVARTAGALEKLDPEKCDLANLLQDFGSEKVIGFLHAFLLLRPVIKSALLTREKKILINSGLL